MVQKAARKRANPDERKGRSRKLKPALGKRRAKRDGPGAAGGTASHVTLAGMRRKGSLATRLYGRKRVRKLVEDQGSPTRFALPAPAWGEPVPRTVAAARRIAAKRRKLLQCYQRSKLR